MESEMRVLMLSGCVAVLGVGLGAASTARADVAGGGMMRADRAPLAFVRNAGQAQPRVFLDDSG